MLPTRLLHERAPVVKAHLGELLDEALQETFPASDPIAVAVELEFFERGISPSAQMRAAQGHKGEGQFD
jgi:hypothetical protein